MNLNPAAVARHFEALQDQFGNATMAGIQPDEQKATVDVLRAANGDGDLVEIKDLEVFFSQVWGADVFLQRKPNPGNSPSCKTLCI